MSLEEIAKGAAWAALSFGNGLFVSYCTTDSNKKSTGITPVFLLPSVFASGLSMSQYGPLPLYASWAGNLAGAVAGYLAGAYLWRRKWDNRPLLDGKEKKELEAIVERMKNAGADDDVVSDITNDFVKFSCPIIRRKGATEFLRNTIKDANMCRLLCNRIECVNKAEGFDGFECPPEDAENKENDKDNYANGVLYVIHRPDYYRLEVRMKSVSGSDAKHDLAAPYAPEVACAQEHRAAPEHDDIILEARELAGSCINGRTYQLVRDGRSQKREYHTGALAESIVKDRKNGKRVVVAGGSAGIDGNIPNIDDKIRFAAFGYLTSFIESSSRKLSGG